MNFVQTTLFYSLYIKIKASISWFLTVPIVKVTSEEINYSILSSPDIRLLRGTLKAYKKF